ncbi:hypothetical protein KIKIMORA_03270 [Brevundimonas phage vB_BpoS-Kikimora]|uniref:Uncharacterized protein n=1 Tax=Brevundimonas phage vB_BpoS-Kikimora TaxID=2948601 RepID=A0A9E7MSW9_9CAUD|nr:hypothetical protein KIKIMORA_03270 [Brevundimonas phage vB_BpoS-Kikimora]
MPVEPKGHFDLDSVTPEELDRIVTEMGGQRAFSRAYGVARSTLQLRLNKVTRDPYSFRPAPEPHVIEINQGIRRFLLTSAQDETAIHEDFLTNLEAYRDYLRKDGPCEIMVSGYVYNKRLYWGHEKDRNESARAERDPSWHYRITPYLTNKRVRLGEMMEFCGEMNTLPTAKTPLTGFETHTKHRWGVIPHAKVQQVSIPTMKGSPAKMLMTTGSVTLPNYVLKRAGITAAVHHTIGAVLVEIDGEGRQFARHLQAEDDGSFIDLDIRVQTWKDNSPRGNTPKITTGLGVVAMNWGDLHASQIDSDVSRACFGWFPVERDGKKTWSTWDGPTILDTLRPTYQFFHDVSDFQARNHHNLRDPHHMFQLFCQGADTVEDELHEVGVFIEKTQRDFCQTVVVESNHDLALRRWLKEADYRHDPVNAEFFLACQRRSYQAIRERDHDFSIFEYVLTEHFADVKCEGVRFLREDESFMVMDIEKGMHGHLGANGARGNPRQFTRMGPKSTTGHTHSAQITDGAYVAGTTSKLDLGYNKGLSSWSHSHVVTLANGKRQIITMQGDKWRL